MERPGECRSQLSPERRNNALEGIVTRPVEAGDHGFLGSLYASSRSAEMARTGWTPDECEAFLAHQFELQHRYYLEQHADAQFLLLLRGERPIGRLYWREHEHAQGQGHEASLIDITLLPEERGRGIGSAWMQQLTARADGEGLTVGLYVEPDNPALRLYQRFGFQATSDNGVYVRMIRHPQAAPAAAHHAVAARHPVESCAR